MSDTTNWAFPDELQPRAEGAGFDLKAALRSVVLLRAEIPEDAFSAQVLGTERIGHGVVIRDDGLVLTIGYLITEASTVWLTTIDGRAVEAHPLAYDQVTGFGLVLPLAKLGIPALPIGSASDATIGSGVTVIGHGGEAHSLNARVIARREFAGYWEYVLDDAIFTAPPHPQWGGTAMIGADGRLMGIGSLLVQESVDGESLDSNMFVPIDLLEPILEDMMRFGRPSRTPRPWLGMYTTEMGGQLVVAGLAQGGPAHQAGVRLGDLVVEVDGRRVSKLAELFRTVWNVGPAGAEIPLTVARGDQSSRVRVRSADRNDLLRKPSVH
jgi:S1-C subfamily serine protease